MWTLLQLMILYVFVMHQVASEHDECVDLWFSEREDVVVSPNFLFPHPHNMSCTYSIDVGRNKSVHLDFLEFFLESPTDADNCTRNWLIITCNETNDENLDFKKRSCGTTLPRTSLRFFNCPVVELKFFADSSVSGGGFVIEYTVLVNVNNVDDIIDLDCGNTMVTRSSGIIRLPRNPIEYSATVNCTYTISANYPSTISVGIFILGRSQLMDSFADCNRDYVMVGCVPEGETELNPNTSNKYCRSSLDDVSFHPSPIIFFNCRTVKISIRSSDYNYQEVNGIPFEVHALDVDCGNTSFTGSAGTISSPHVPLSYPHGLDCVYTIDVDRTKTISLDFLSFNLEGTSHYPMLDSCSHDWLKISCLSDDSERGSRSQENKYCGEISVPITLNYSQCDSLTLNLVTESINSSVISAGFQLHYTITSADVPDKGCGNTSFTGPVGFIASPRFPLSYPNSLDCIYSIDVDRTKMVELRFLSFNLEGTSHSSYLDNCHHDWLMISCLANGSEANHHHWNRKYCGEKTTPLILRYSNCDSLTLNFVTNSYWTRGGFQLRYTISLANDTDCGGTSYSGPNGIVTSPDFPFPYPHNISCRYFIDVGHNKSVLLKFKHFHLEMPNSADYCKDWLMISCNETAKANPNNNKKYCGSIQWVSSMRFVDCSSLVLEFFSDSSVNSAGFMIEYTVAENSNATDDNSELDCGATLFTNSSGVINLPENPKNYLATVNCTYTISTNHMSYVWLDTYFSPEMPLLQSFQDCDREGLMIGCVSEGETELNPNTTRIFCRGWTSHNPSSHLVFADCRTLKLSIRSTNYDNRETFRIHFSVYGQSEICGDTSFSALYGIISSGRLPWHYSHGVNCLYTIDSGHVNCVVLSLDVLSFHYNDMDIPYADCNSGWLTISCLVNGTSVPHPLADRKLCQVRELPIIEFPACRRVLLNYSSDYISHNTGFSIHYTMGDYDPECGNTFYSEPSGRITSPGFPLYYAHNLNCLYSITGGQGNTISLFFPYFSLKGSSNAPAIDSCDSEWLTVSCLSDESVGTNTSSSRRYCGYKMTTPLELTFPRCEVVVLNFLSDSTVTGGGFFVHYRVIDTDSLCGVPVYGPPSGVISFSPHYVDHVDNFDCIYTINATEPSSISLTIWSIISLQSLPGLNCQSDWLLITCINGQTTLDHRESHSTCDHQNSSTRLTFPNCAAVQVVIHKESDVNWKTFRIEYTVNAYGTSQSPAISASTQLPITHSAKCEVGCKKSEDGTTCDCSTTHSGDAIVDAQKGSSGKRGRAIGISLTVILLVAGAICLGAFLLFRRHRKKNRSEMLIQASEIEEHQLEMEDDSSEAGSLFRGHRNEDRDTSSYLPLRPMSISDHQESSSSRNSLTIDNEIQPSL